jgi:hypothetical protein
LVGRLSFGQSGLSSISSFLVSLGQQSGVIGSGVLRSFDFLLSFSNNLSSSLESDRGNNSLDLRALEDRFLSFLLRGDFSFNGVSFNVIFLGQHLHIIGKLHQKLTNNFLILEARLGPNRRGLYLSVRPGISSDPFLTMIRFMAWISGPTMHPRTDFLRRSPCRLGR